MRSDPLHRRATPARAHRTPSRHCRCRTDNLPHGLGPPSSARPGRCPHARSGAHGALGWRDLSGRRWSGRTRAHHEREWRAAAGTSDRRSRRLGRRRSWSPPTPARRPTRATWSTTPGRWELRGLPPPASSTTPSRPLAGSGQTAWMARPAPPPKSSPLWPREPEGGGSSGSTAPGGGRVRRRPVLRRSGSEPRRQLAPASYRCTYRSLRK